MKFATNDSCKYEYDFGYFWEYEIIIESDCPNKNILINSITINEAKDSSEIENIITTHDELYKAMSQSNYSNSAAKEVVNYRTALWHGYKIIKNQNMLTTNMINPLILGRLRANILI